MAITKVTSALTDLDGGITIDNITIDGTEIDLSSGDLTIDVAGNIRLDADDNGEVRLLDGGTQYGALKIDSSRFKIQSIVQDADMLFAGNDNGSEITALTLDMSDAGTATFNNKVNVTGRLQPSEHIIFQSNNGYLQFPAASSGAWAMASSGGSNAPGTQSTSFAFHRWDGSN